LKNLVSWIKKHFTHDKYMIIQGEYLAGHP
jgi:hypothetical protein